MVVPKSIVILKSMTTLKLTTTSHQPTTFIAPTSGRFFNKQKWRKREDIAFASQKLTFLRRSETEKLCFSVSLASLKGRTYGSHPLVLPGNFSEQIAVFFARPLGRVSAVGAKRSATTLSSEREKTAICR